MSNRRVIIKLKFKEKTYSLGNCNDNDTESSLLTKFMRPDRNIIFDQKNYQYKFKYQDVNNLEDLFEKLKKEEKNIVTIELVEVSKKDQSKQLLKKFEDNQINQTQSTKYQYFFKQTKSAFIQDQTLKKTINNVNIKIIEQPAKQQKIIMKSEKANQQQKERPNIKQNLRKQLNLKQQQLKKQQQQEKQRQKQKQKQRKRQHHRKSSSQLSRSQSDDQSQKSTDNQIKYGGQVKKSPKKRFRDKQKEQNKKILQFKNLQGTQISIIKSNQQQIKEKNIILSQQKINKQSQIKINLQDQPQINILKEIQQQQKKLYPVQLMDSMEIYNKNKPSQMIVIQKDEQKQQMKLQIKILKDKVQKLTIISDNLLKRVLDLQEKNGNNQFDSIKNKLPSSFNESDFMIQKKQSQNQKKPMQNIKKKLQLKQQQYKAVVILLNEKKSINKTETYEPKFRIRNSGKKSWPEQVMVFKENSSITYPMKSLKPDKDDIFSFEKIKAMKNDKVINHLYQIKYFDTHGNLIDIGRPFGINLTVQNEEEKSPIKQINNKNNNNINNKLKSRIQAIYQKLKIRKQNPEGVIKNLSELGFSGDNLQDLDDELIIEVIKNIKE